MKQLSVVIVNYHSGELLTSCVTSLLETSSPDLEIFIINNGSADELAGFANSKRRNLHLIQNSSNLGYAAGANIGFRQSQRELVLVLNPDVLVQEQSLEVLTETLKTHPNAAIVLPRLTDSDGELQYSCRKYYTYTTLLMRRSPFNRFFPNHPAVRQHLMLDWDHQTLAEVDWGLGAAMLIRRSAIQEPYLFDERFFLYFEDVDLCFRVRQRGWNVLYNPAASMIHQHRRESAQSWNYQAKKHHFVSLSKFLWKYRFQLRMEPTPKVEKSSALQNRRN
jgi:N-acetylglucosaminyl-diphospho-decaprenol L-rhamnosyltransferase